MMLNKQALKRVFAFWLALLATVAVILTFVGLMVLLPEWVVIVIVVLVFVAGISVLTYIDEVDRTRDRRRDDSVSIYR